MFVSFKAIFTSQIGTLGSISLLEAIRNNDKEIKFIKPHHQKCMEVQ